MTIMNFVVHRDRGPGQETDADVLGVRFPHRAEGPPEDPMADDEHLLRVYSKRTAASKRPYVIIAEVTKQRCKLNGPWTNRGRGNMQRVLAAIGAIEEAEREQAATALYGPGVYENKDIYMSLCCLGNRESGHIASGRPDVPQIVWGHVATFIYRRFDTHFETKRSHPQWDRFGQHLWRLRESSGSPELFRVTIENAIEMWGSCEGRCHQRKTSLCVRSHRKKSMDEQSV